MASATGASDGCLSLYSLLYTLLMLVWTGPPNFITEIFYLTLAASHIGQQKIVNVMEGLGKQYDELRRHLELLNGDQSWRGVSILLSVIAFRVLTQIRRLLVKRRPKLRSTRRKHNKMRSTRQRRHMKLNWASQSSSSARSRS